MNEIEEALKELEEELKWTHNDGVNLTKYDESLFNVIKQALTTKSKKEQALDVIIKKEVSLFKIRDFYGLKDFESCSSYNAYREAFNYKNKEMLTEEEFNLIKEMLKCI
jgi:thiamine biosynthesis lipoprotein ApbE